MLRKLPPEPKSHYMTVDPGLNTGWAIFSPDEYTPLHIGRISYKERASCRGVDSVRLLSLKLQDMLRQFDLVIEAPPYKFDIFIEGTEDQHSVRSRTAFSSGRLQVLTYLVGAYFARSHGRGMIIPPSLWKGTLNKTALASRVYRVLNTKYKEHILDAVAMGLSLKGVL